MKPTDLSLQSGYTLVELVIVLSLSAIFLLLALQNFGPRREFATFQANVEKIKASLRSAQGQGSVGRGDEHFARDDNVNDTVPPGGTLKQYGSVLCGTMLDLKSDATYEYYRINARQLRSVGIGFADNPIADQAGELYPFTSIGGPQSIPSASFTITQDPNSQPIDDLHVYFVGAVTGNPTAQVFAWPASSDPNGSPTNPTSGCQELVDTGADTGGKTNILITVNSGSGNHSAVITLSPTTGLITSEITK